MHAVCHILTDLKLEAALTSSSLWLKYRNLSLSRSRACLRLHLQPRHCHRCKLCTHDIDDLLQHVRYYAATGDSLVPIPIPTFSMLHAEKVGIGMHGHEANWGYGQVFHKCNKPAMSEWINMWYSAAYVHVLLTEVI